MKITVYAICKNEESNIGAFLRGLADADNIVLLDTGSSDGTLQFAKSFNDPRVVIETAVIDPFSFSIARNMCLTVARERAPADWYLFLDLDERLPANWRHIVDSANITDDMNCLFLQMVLGDKGEQTSYAQLKAHRDVFEWRYSAHEVLVPIDGMNQKGLYLPIMLTHLKDESKKRDYLEPLEIDYLNAPNDHRTMFYYGRELFYAERYVDAYNILVQAEHATTGYFVGQQLEVYYLMYSMRVKTHPDVALSLLYKALSLSPFSREALYKLALHFYDHELYYAAIGTLEHLLNSTSADNLILFKDVGSHTWKPHDLMCVCFNAIGDIENALHYAEQAYKLNPDQERVAANYKYFVGLTQKQGDSDAPSS
jgi:glycosyltransferase involved in cell wall biosynthesis